jgi:hypothetical protein
MNKSLGIWLVGNAGLISVIGALIIFFSWVVTNTLGQHYSRLKQSVETADTTFRLYTTLHELRDSLNSVAMETVSTRDAVEQISKNPQDRERSELASFRRQYSYTRMSAHQIEELMDFANQTLNYSSSIETVTPTSQTVAVLHKDIYSLYARVRELNHAVELANTSPDPQMIPLRNAIEHYVTYVEKDAIPRVADLYKAIVNTSNDRRDEGRRELAQSKRKASRAAHTVLLLYAVGSLFALGGQYLDKVYKKKFEASTGAATSPADSTRAADPAGNKSHAH